MGSGSGQMLLIIGDDRHLLKEGITLLGSADNDRYSTIRINEKSICAKHAAIRYSKADNTLHIMDLCSHGGTFLSTSAVESAGSMKIPALEWRPVSAAGGRFILGGIECRLEQAGAAATHPAGPAGRKSSRCGSGASFFGDDDSADFIDCSLEEAPLTKSRSEPKTLQRSSGLASFSAKDASLQQASFLAPATQQVANVSSTSGGGAQCSIQEVTDITNASGAAGEEPDDDDEMFFIPETQDCNEDPNRVDDSQIIEPISSTIGEGSNTEDFLCFETQDERNTGDGIFNNPYVEQSQNLLQNLDESYKRDCGVGAAVEEVGEPSKSILPDRSVDSIEDLSKLEWNETKNTSKATTVGEQDRDGSVTPELLFDQPVKNPALSALANEDQEERSDSVTPDLDFDRITPQQTVAQVSTKVSLIRGAKEASEEQERAESVTPDLFFGKTAAVAEERDRSGSVTPELSFVEERLEEEMLEEEHLEEEDDNEAEISLNQEGNTSKQSLDPYDMPTQMIEVNDEEEEEDPYLLPTQQMTVESKFKVPAPVDDLPTQAFEPEVAPMRKAAVRVVDLASSKKDVSMRINKEIELNAYEVATQPFPAVEPPANVYDCQTQALGDDLDDTGPAPGAEDAYDLQTQAFPGHSTTNLYDVQTQPLIVATNDAGEEDHEISKNFRPPVNSTCRPSMLLEPTISPSSDKENRVEVNQQESEDLLGFTQPESCEGFDEEYCLASTMPASDSTDKQPQSSSVFKVPDQQNSASTLKSTLSGGSDMQTPSRSKGSNQAGGAGDTCSFDFNTPDHPFLNVAKKESILAVSEMIQSRTKQKDTLRSKNKYIFGDSSEEDDEPNEPVFKKKDSKVQVMKYDRSEKAEIAAQEAAKKEPAPAPERRSTRERKKKQYSTDEEDNKSASNSSKSSNRSTSSKSSKGSAPKSKVKDESVDYQQSITEEKPMRTRKRKALEEKESEPAPKPAKSKKAAAQQEPQPGPSKPPAATVAEPAARRPGRPKRSTAADDKLNTSNSTTASSESETGTRRSTRVRKPRLMFTKMSPEPYRRMITRSGGTIVDLPEQATILVSDGVYRTYKFLCAIARGIPIVGQPYMEAVRAAQDFVDPWDHILADAETERRFKFNLKKSLQMACEARLFLGHSVYVTGSTKPPPEELHLIVASAGGRALKFPSQQPKPGDELFVISDPKDKDDWPKIRKQHPGIEIISTEGFMLSIMQHYKNFRSYRLA